MTAFMTAARATWEVWATIAALTVIALILLAASNRRKLPWSREDDEL